MAKKFPRNVKDFVKENVKGISSMELMERVNKYFDSDYKLNQIKNMVYGQGLKSGLNTRFKGEHGIEYRFKKGHEPLNKGRKVRHTNPNVIRNYFQKGHIPANTVPVGSEQTREGYVWVKIAQPNTWKQKHRLLWEQHHGPIKKGYLVTFLDGNQLNIDIANLAVISQREHSQLNLEKLRFNDQELTKTGINIVKLNIAIKDKMNKVEDNPDAKTDRK